MEEINSFQHKMIKKCFSEFIQNYGLVAVENLLLSMFSLLNA